MKPSTLSKHSAIHGLYIGLVLSVLTFAYFISTGNLAAQKGIASWGPTVLYITGLYFFTQRFRNQQQGDGFSYGLAFKTLFLTGVYASLVQAFFQYLILRFSPDALRQMLLIMQESYQESGAISESELENIMALLQKFLTPGLMAFSSFVGMIITTTFFSLIIAIFLKQNPTNPQSNFDRDMANIE